MADSLKIKDFALTEIVITLMVAAILAAFFLKNLSQIIFRESPSVSLAQKLAEKYLQDTKTTLSSTVNFDNLKEGTGPPLPLSEYYTYNNSFLVKIYVTDLKTQIKKGRMLATSKKIDIEYLKQGNAEPLFKKSLIIIRPE
jgi:hypothetical protein